MSQYEYKVIPTPRRPKRAKGVKGEPARFANVLTEAINEIAVEGWEFYKTETLPMDAKPGIFAKRTETFQSVMVFRKIIPVSSIEAAAQNAADPVLTSATVPAIADPDETPLTALDDTPDKKFEFPEEEGPREPSSSPVEDDDTEKVTFDSENMDPLKYAVEANRKPDPSE